MNLFVKKPIQKLIAEADDTEKGIKRTLGAGNLIALGIGAIIGAGLFVRTAAAAANNAGPSVTLGFVLAAVGCAFAGLCYAEFASMIPIAGSAYTYSYATMGEFVAWIIGWDLVLEYGIGAATVSIAWSEYLNKLLVFFSAGQGHQGCGRRVARLRRLHGHPRRRGRGVLRVHRIRCGLDRCPGDRQSQPRHADRHPRLARDLHRARHPALARNDLHRVRRG